MRTPHNLHAVLMYLRDELHQDITLDDLASKPADEFDVLLQEQLRWSNAGRFNESEPPVRRNSRWDDINDFKSINISEAITSDATIAEFFIDRFGDGLRYVHQWGKWMTWHAVSGVWRKDETQYVSHLMHKQQIRHVFKYGGGAAEGEGWNSDKVNSVLSQTRTTRCIQYASAHKGIAASAEQWDTDSWLLNTPHGIVDLRSGAMRPHEPALYMSKATAVTPKGDCPLWLAFLDKITGKDKELQSYLKRLCGYALTGCTNEDAFFFSHGSGKNGKTTFWETIADIMGDYAVTVPAETFMTTHNEPHPTVLAKMQGARLVRADEIEKDQKWALSKLKLLTGGGKISARFMRQDFFEYTPQFKLCLSGNHKPGVGVVDMAIRRRLNLLPFKVTIPEGEVDTSLSEKLRQEWPGILRWMIQGCLEWQKIGLRPPASVTDATGAYLAEQDRTGLGQWIQQSCVVGAGYECGTTLLRTSFVEWAKVAEQAQGDIPGQKKLSEISAKAFATELQNRGYEVKPTRSISMAYGLTLKPQGPQGEPEEAD